MTLRLTRALWLWAGGLSLAVLLMLPQGVGWRALVAVLVILVVVRGWRQAERKAARLRHSLHLAEGACLPPAGYRQPVVLVCGDGLAALFGGDCSETPCLKMTTKACYLGVRSPEQLPDVVAALEERRPGWSKQLSVMFVVNPGERNDAAALAGQVRALGHQLALISRRGSALPLSLVTYRAAAQGHEVWFSWHAGQACPRVHEAAGCSSFDDWQRECDASHVARVQAGVCVNGTLAWLEDKVLPHLAGSGSARQAVEPLALGIALVPVMSGQVVGNLWQQWTQEQLALMSGSGSTQAEVEPLPFPDPLLALLPVRRHMPPKSRAAIRALWLLALAGVVGLCSSASQNHQLIRQVSADLQRYASIPAPERTDEPAHALREEAIAVLRAHAARLDSYRSGGVPLALGLGLYRDEPMRTRLLDALLAHRQPPAPPEPIAVPQVVRLNSLSLFDSGSARLKAGSTRVLVNALVDIKAQPGWLIVIAGHTDATGNRDDNLRLSRARAAAVRDWMQHMGDIPDSCFAVQGFGAEHPVASNDTQDGRMSNRRVDIRLLPAEGACLATSVVSG